MGRERGLRRAWSPVASVLLCTLGAVGCGDGDEATPAGPVVVTPAPVGEPFERLSAWHLFVDAKKHQPAERVLGYEVASPLWSDATSKHRFMYVPEGAQIGYEASERWAFPEGTILVKSFGYLADARDPSSAERLLETRLLVHEPSGWVPLTYVWDEAGRDATLELAGDSIPVSFVDAEGEQHALDYSVPNANMCKECHGEPSTRSTLGGRTRQLNRVHEYETGSENQIDHLASLGWLDQTPPPEAEREALPDPFGSAPVSERARSYLDANCAHCHSAGNAASSSGLTLDFAKTSPAEPAVSYGVCKTPTSAGGATCGLSYDIVPKAPEQSILVCRLKSREPKVQMPPLATKLAHRAAIELVTGWIAEMTEPACQ